MTKHASDLTVQNKKIRVFVVDDHHAIIEGIKLILSEVNDIIFVGGTIIANTALDNMAIYKPDVVLVDVALQGTEDGLEIARSILTRYPEKYVIIYTTDRNNTKDLLDLCLQFGVHGYLLKNKPLSELVLAIRSVFGGNIWIDPTISADLITKIRATQETTEALTVREIEILSLLVEDLSNKELAVRLNITENTVARHLSNIYQKINVKKRSSAIKWANKSGLRK